MADYVLVMANDVGGPPLIIGALVANGGPGRVAGEAAVGEGKVDVRLVDAAISLLRELPAPGEASARDWLTGLDGLTTGIARIVGPWSWDVEDREVLHWVLDHQRLTARTVAVVRDGRVVSFPNTDPHG